MSIQSKILLHLARKFFDRDEQHGFSQNTGIRGQLQDRASAAITTVKREIPFITVAIVITLIFIVTGLYEIIVATPLHDWFVQAWHTVIQSSPQSIADLPKQVPNDLMTRTVGDWFAYIPSLFKQIIPIIVAPLDTLLAVIVVCIALAMRVGRFALGRIGGTAKGLSWAMLAFSFSPLLLDYYVW